LIRVLRLITGTGVPRINHEARINHANEPDVAAVTEAASMAAFTLPGPRRENELTGLGG
jgi:hypothetical protein